MPHYDYQCNACHAVFEVEHAMGAKPRVKCPACGSTNTVKQFGAAGVHFTGSGFYVTDSRNSDKKLTSGKDITPKGESTPDATPTADKSTKPESTAKTEASADSKPAKTPKSATE